ncbi:MAG: hypothetical protein ABIK15_08425 [Pseudomonadota bacterium]
MDAIVLTIRVAKDILFDLHIKIVIAAILLICCPAASQGAGKSGWDQWLDQAYQLTWLDQNDIDDWIIENEKKTFDKKLLVFANEWEQRLSEKTVPGEIGPYPIAAYRQLAIAQMLLYLRSSDPVHLEKALVAANQEILKSKIELPEVAFWYFYIRAHHNMISGNSVEFVHDIYRIWFDVVLRLESAQFGFGPSSSLNNLRGYYQSIPYLYRNLANLIIRRAIVQRRMPNIDSLGVIVLNLSQRMPGKGYGKWIEHIVNRMYGPESDNFHLAYTVLFLEAEKLHQTTEDLIDAAKDAASIERSLISTFEYYDFLYELAKTGHGKASATIRRLNLISFITSRLYEKGPKQSFLVTVPLLQSKDGKAWHESKKIVPDAIKLFYELSSPGILEKDWQRNGFLNREIYVAAMHDFWRAIMYNCMDTGIYYQKLIHPEQAGTLRQNIPLLIEALSRYLTFFDYYAAKGDLDIVPDDAFFGAVEAAELLSDIHFLAASWADGVQNYKLFLARRLQAAEIFPFDVHNYYVLVKRLAGLGRLELYKKSLFLLAYRVRNSKVIAASSDNNEHYMGFDLQVLQELIPKIILYAPDNIVLQDGLNSIPNAISNRIDIILKELTSKAQDHQIGADKLGRMNDFATKMRNKLTATSFAPKEITLILEELRYINSIIKEISDLQDKAKPAQYQAMGRPAVFSKFFNQFSLDLKQIEDEGSILVKLSEIKEMRDTMILEMKHPFHTLLRRLYHEYPHENFNYLRVLKGENPMVPFSLDSLQQPGSQADNSRLQRLTTNQMNTE